MADGGNGGKQARKGREKPCLACRPPVGDWFLAAEKNLFENPRIAMLAPLAGAATQ
jgi:hypothetical protein